MLYDTLCYVPRLFGKGPIMLPHVWNPVRLLRLLVHFLFLGLVLFLVLSSLFGFHVLFLFLGHGIRECCQLGLLSCL
jgi:hypothetical protein